MSGNLDSRGLPPGYPFRPDWEITAREALDRLGTGASFVLVDVRTPEEAAVTRVPGSLHVPLDQLAARIEELDPQAEVAFLCHHGVRSLKAAAIARAHGIDRAVSVAGGIDLWSLSADPAVRRYMRGPDGRPALRPDDLSGR